MKTAKTNAVRLLDRLGIRYELREYEVDPEDLAAETVARKVGMPPEQVWKTLVCRGDKHGVCFALLPGNAELDPKALARVTGDKSIDTCCTGPGAWDGKGRSVIIAGIPAKTACAAQRPLNGPGLRFSAKARAASWKSSLR